jgi:hypothetical protein
VRKMAFPNPPMITDLPEDKRKLAKEQIAELKATLKECAVYAENRYATGQSNFLKCFGMMEITKLRMTEIADELRKIHGLQSGSADRCSP